jgi:hypothetical protein
VRTVTPIRIPHVDPDQSLASVGMHRYPQRLPVRRHRATNRRVSRLRSHERSRSCWSQVTPPNPSVSGVVVGGD